MKLIDFCKICDNYIVNKKCDIKESCKIVKLLEENKELKKENRDLRLKISYMINPNAINERNDMGW